ncbi:MAG: hypothetical protein ABSG63_09455 [Spirochaetia bacterium]|jgi:hypothetical protein
MKAEALMAAFLLAAAAAAVADHIPVPPDGALTFQARTALIANFGNADLVAELLGGQESVNQALQFHESLTLGGYYRVLKNLKLGAFYRLQAGVHHDDDWVTNASPPPGFVWQDTSTRFEHLLMLDASPRFLLDFLPGRDWVFMLKGRFIYNASYENQMSLMARPELTWFWIQDRVPILNVSLSYELYFPLNFGTTLLYQSYPYLSLLWHATPEVGIELGGAWKSTTWSPSQDVMNSGQSIAGAFPITFHTWVVSLGVVYTPSF